MAQYTTGTASVNNGSATVNGSGTTWLANVTVGDWFTITDSGLSYQVAAVVSDTELTLSGTYQGTTASGSTYVIFRDFTDLGFPLLYKNDLQTATAYSRAMVLIDDIVQTVAVTNWLDPVVASNLIDDTLTAPPGTFITGDVFILGGSGSGAWAAFSSGEIVQYNGSTWDSLGILASGDRFGISISSTTSATNTFSGKDNQIAEWNGASWAYTTPSNRDAFLVRVSDLQEQTYQYLYLTATLKWVLIGEAVSSISIALDDVSDVTITSLGTDELLFTQDGSTWVNQTLAEAGIAAATHTHVEADITDLGAYLENIVEDVTPQLGGDLDVNGNDILCGDNLITQPEIKDYAITNTTPSSSSGAITFDYSLGQSFSVTLSENITAITLSNPPVSGKFGEIHIKFKQPGTTYTVSGWPAAVKWSGGDVYVATAVTGAIDTVVLTTDDAGTTWLANHSKGYA